MKIVKSNFHLNAGFDLEENENIDSEIEGQDEEIEDAGE